MTAEKINQQVAPQLWQVFFLFIVKLNIVRKKSSASKYLIGIFIPLGVKPNKIINWRDCSEWKWWESGGQRDSRGRSLEFMMRLESRFKLSEEKQGFESLSEIASLF